MNISHHGLGLLTNEEGFVATPYRDSAGVLTVAWGHVIRPGEVFDKPLSRDEGLRLLQQDLARFEASVNQVGQVVGLMQRQYDALVVFAFNVGVAGFEGSTVRARLLNRDPKGAADAMLVWCYAIDPATDRTTINDVLAGRRWRERALFLGEDGSWMAYQQTLAALGYDPGPLDGIPGPKTRSAIAKLVDYVRGGGRVWTRDGDTEPPEAA